MERYEDARTYCSYQRNRWQKGPKGDYLLLESDAKKADQGNAFQVTQLQVNDTGTTVSGRLTLLSKQALDVAHDPC